MIIRTATTDEQRAYSADNAHNLIVAEDAGRVVGWCEYANDTIYLIESYATGQSRALRPSSTHAIGHAHNAEERD